MKAKRLLMDEIVKDGFAVCERKLNYDYPLHWHEFYEIEYVLEGEGEFIINDKKHPAQKGSFFFITPIDFQRIVIKKRPLKVINIVFDGSWIEKELGSIIGTTVVAQEYRQEKINMLFEEYKSRRSLWKFCCRQILNLILSDVCRIQGNSGKTVSSDFIRHEQIYLQKHFFEDITLETAAARAGFSKNYFSQLFHKETGKTFINYLTDLRITHAALLAEHTNRSVAHICEQCGFKNTAHFMRLFKKTYGVTVFQYRKNMRSERKEQIM